MLTICLTFYIFNSFWPEHHNGTIMISIICRMHQNYMQYLLTSSQCLCKYFIWTVYSGAPTFFCRSTNALQTCETTRSNCERTIISRLCTNISQANYVLHDLWAEDLSRQLPKWFRSISANASEAFAVSACCQTLPRTHFRCPDLLEGDIVCFLHSVKRVE